jgi:CheY-like chemotaxis protein
MIRRLRKSPEKGDCEQPVALAVANAIPENLPKGSETVLLAEDEEVVRVYTALILRDLGYHVIEAADGEQALRLLREGSGLKIDLLLTDIVMPKMNGKELAYRIGQLLPQVKVLFCSGYPEKLAARNGMIAPTVRFLQKPVVPRTLAIKVREVLDEAKLDFPQGTALADKPSDVNDPTQNGGQAVVCDN